MNKVIAVKDVDGIASLSTEEPMEATYHNLPSNFDHRSDDAAHQPYQDSGDLDQNFEELKRTKRRTILAHKIRSSAFTILLAFALGVVAIWALGITFPVSSILFAGGSLLIFAGLACLANQWTWLAHGRLAMQQHRDQMIDDVTFKGTAEAA